MNRRQFIATSALATAGAAVGHGATESEKPRIKLGISSYSYWHFKTAKVPIGTVIDKAAALGAAYRRTAGIRASPDPIQSAGMDDPRRAIPL